MSNRQKSSFSCKNLFLSLLFSAALTGVAYYFFQMYQASSKNDSTNPDSTNLSFQAMDTSDLTLNASTIIKINWIDISCTVDKSIVPDKDVLDTIQRTNGVYVRSNASFMFALGARYTVLAESCGTTLSNVNYLDQLYAMGKNASIATSVYPITVFSLQINDDSISVRTKGFTKLGSLTSFIDKKEMSLYSVTLAHELGHAMNLVHPFTDNGQKVYDDIPVVCSSGKNRALFLDSCPETANTCMLQNNTEILTNTMDYLPEKCGRKYTFSQTQVVKMKTFLKI